jgi:hypothetical protein
MSYVTKLELIVLKVKKKQIKTTVRNKQHAILERMSALTSSL